LAVPGCVAPESPCHWSGGLLACLTARFDDGIAGEKGIFLVDDYRGSMGVSP